jgi:SNF2 family DNA or RNA helicase
MSEDGFTTRFNPSEQRETADGKTYIDERSGRHFELQARLRSNIMVRRLKRDVLPQLKIPFLDIVHVEETGAVKQALQAEKLLDIDPEDMTGLDMSVRGQVSTVRRMMGLAIAPMAADYVDMLLDGGEEKVCVFAWHIEVLDILMAKLAKYSPLRIDGSTPATRKPQLVAQFAKPGHRLLIGNILSMGTGTDGLQEACQRGVAAEASWVSGDNIQMVDRLDRMGQSGQVLFDFLVAPGSFSEHVLGSSIRKAKITHAALDKQMNDW